MNLVNNPKKKQWLSLTTRPIVKTKLLKKLVKKVFKNIVSNGDKALRKYSLLFDKVAVLHFKIEKNEITEAIAQVPEPLKKAINQAMENIMKFHEAQKENNKIVETTPGVKCWRENRPIENVGIYIPGGTAPLFSTVLMLGIPAKIAGCKEIILCTPPNKNGKIDATILFTAHLIGIKKIFKIGGIQAIGALTFGTRSIPKVDKIFGPGNQFVTAAKQTAQNYGVAIDLPAGPSELLVIADDSCISQFVAADLLSQAEHGIDSQVLLLTNSKLVAENIMKEVKKQTAVLPRKETVKKVLKNSQAIVFKTIDACIAFSNLYAPEHLIMAIKKPDDYLQSIKCAGSVFIGNYSCESAGDYASGTNHTLPTNGYARNYSGVSLDSFVKKITFQELSADGIKNLGETIELMATAEQLYAHKNAVTVRLKYLEKRINN
jgi:histidinol dehydrogenase